MCVRFTAGPDNSREPDRQRGPANTRISRANRLRRFTPAGAFPLWRVWLVRFHHPLTKCIICLAGRHQTRERVSATFVLPATIPSCAGAGMSRKSLPPRPCTFSRNAGWAVPASCGGAISGQSPPWSMRRCDFLGSSFLSTARGAILLWEIFPIGACPIDDAAGWFYSSPRLVTSGAMLALS